VYDLREVDFPLTLPRISHNSNNSFTWPSRCVPHRVLPFSIPRSALTYGGKRMKINSPVIPTSPPLPGPAHAAGGGSPQRASLYKTHTLQSCPPHGILSIFHLSAHILIPRITSTSSSPLEVRVYSLRTGNVVAST
jgi:hypothetical protein